MLTEMAWITNGTPNTLTGTADDIDITDLTGKKFNLFLNYKITSGNTSVNYTFNNDSTANYALRLSNNGAADGTGGNLTKLDFWQDLTDTFEIFYVFGTSSEEKLVINFIVGQGRVGAGNAPTRVEYVAKWVNTSDTIDRIDCNNNQSGDYAVDTNLSALGTD